MKLRFYPKPGMLSWDPERRPNVAGGAPAGYVGRTLVRAVKEGERVIKPAYYKANSEPYEVFAGTHSGRRLAKLCLRGELWAADESTAAFCGVSFQRVVQGKDGEWAPAPRKKKDD